MYILYERIARMTGGGFTMRRNSKAGADGADQDKGPGPGKVRITIRLDGEVIDWFRARAVAKGGGNYQTMINNALREYISQGGESLESVLRRVVREEMKATGPEADNALIPRGRL
jgi:uncharacterized protein (DUF4415 family)